MNFPHMLVTFRRSAGLSQMALARKTGIDHSYCSRLESGQRQPTPGMVRRIADELDLDTSDRVRLYLSAGYIPTWVARDDALLEVLAATIVVHEPRTRTATVKGRAA